MKRTAARKCDSSGAVLKRERRRRRRRRGVIEVADCLPRPVQRVKRRDEFKITGERDTRPCSNRIVRYNIFTTLQHPTTSVGGDLEILCTTRRWWRCDVAETSENNRRSRQLFRETETIDDRRQYYNAGAKRKKLTTRQLPTRRRRLRRTELKTGA